MANIVFVQSELRDRIGTMYLIAMLKIAGHQCDVFL